MCHSPGEADGTPRRVPSRRFAVACGQCPRFIGSPLHRESFPFDRQGPVSSQDACETPWRLYKGTQVRSRRTSGLHPAALLRWLAPRPKEDRADVGRRSCYGPRPQTMRPERLMVPAKNAETATIGRDFHRPRSLNCKRHRFRAFVARQGVLSSRASSRSRHGEVRHRTLVPRIGHVAASQRSTTSETASAASFKSSRPCPLTSRKQSPRSLARTARIMRQSQAEADSSLDFTIP